MRKPRHPNLLRRLAPTAALPQHGGAYALLRDAFLEMRPSLPAGAPGRYLFDDCARDDGRCCFQPVLRAMELAVANGASLEQIGNFTRALDTAGRKMIEDRDGVRVPRPISTLLLEEAHADAAADIAQAHALHEPRSPARLHELIASSERHKSVIDRLLDVARRSLLVGPHTA